MQLNGLLNLESLAINYLQGACAQGRDVDLAISRVDVEVHCGIFLALGVSEGNLLNQSMSRGVKDGHTTGAGNKSFTGCGVDAHLAGVVNFAFCAGPDHLLGRGIHHGYGAVTSLGHPHVTGSLVIADTVGGCNLLTRGFGGSARGEVHGRELVDRCKARCGGDIPGAQTAGQDRRTAGGEGSEQGRGSRCVSQLVLAGQTLILGSAYAKMTALVIRVLCAGCCGQGGIAVSRKRRGNHGHRSCDDGEGAGDGEQLA